MKTRKEIEDRIAELDVIIAEDNKVSEENYRLYNEAQNKLAADLLDHLKDAGYPVNEYTTVDTRTMVGTKAVTARFSNKNRSEFYVTFGVNKVNDVSASGISSRSATPEDLADMGSYYTMVAAIMERLNSKYFSTNMALFFDALDNYKEPEMKMGIDGISKMREERRDLEKMLKVLDLGLEIGKSVEVFFEGNGRRYRSCWRQATIEKMTEKTICVDCGAYGNKVINRYDILNKIRLTAAIA